jgi:hypothetical protein
MLTHQYTIWDEELYEGSNVAYLLKARTVEPEKQLLLANSSLNTPTARQWFSSCHLITARDAHTTMEEWLNVVFSGQSVPRLCEKDQLLL